MQEPETVLDMVIEIDADGLGMTIRLGS